MSDCEPTFEDIWKVLDIVKIYENLWQGAFPPPGDLIASKGLCLFWPQKSIRGTTCIQV